MTIARQFAAVVGLIVSVAFASCAFAQSDDPFEKANKDFAQGQFQDAIKGYQGLVGAGQWSTSLFYNLGNAYFRAADFGHAILNYERALALDPHHPEATANLSVARDEARALELQKSRDERFLKFVTPNQIAIGAAVALWVGVFAVAGIILARRRFAMLVVIAILAFCVGAVAIAALYRIDKVSSGLAVVTDHAVEARLATADNARSVLLLPPGSEIQVLSRRGDWVYATLPNNLRGWIPNKAVESVRL
ncbi:MAG: hypothetical protein QOI34_956 [Verrucomicrobiota bacterium]